MISHECWAVQTLINKLCGLHIQIVSHTMELISQFMYHKETEGFILGKEQSLIQY